MGIKHLHIYVPLSSLPLIVSETTHPSPSSLFWHPPPKSYMCVSLPRFQKRSLPCPNFFKNICPLTRKTGVTQSNFLPSHHCADSKDLLVHRSLSRNPGSLLQPSFLFLFLIQFPICHLLATAYLDFPRPAQTLRQIPNSIFGIRITYIK